MNRTSILGLILFSFLPAIASANLITGDGIPLVQYNTLTGLVLVDTDGANVTGLGVDFYDSETGQVSEDVNHFFDNSPTNPLFAEYGGIIPEWRTGFVGETIYAELNGVRRPAGTLTPWAQISAGLTTDNFIGAKYWLEGSSRKYTDIQIVPEPATLAMLGIGTLAIRKNIFRN
ncbi:hypothetical protein STSP2_00916 [Anaerohalosphaera lusitana]|uniref:Ice-binding protein C-terminal domain-containing protein n=1 Tax=Anaerohalosphaera lusitana TaxID=1936003 RepID=A0A1U9NJ06_9BACT|nr:PEP-CTERM sorting domain-containing protein [Anaerohalosphaera lusitana]AQT67767.1 hypothetical protein STSP2_00916 [Anaerohalosphaera lusitana]